VRTDYCHLVLADPVVRTDGSTTCQRLSKGHGNEDRPALRLSVARPIKRRTLLHAHTRSPEPLLPTSPVVCEPFIRSERGD
jgi:hypothetical protein